ncbi:hypothetical protein [Shewanella sp. Isolate11]|uniref:hypothetical protein n=1 Tax=Shewanella sp. Isolate11 TaxID=2908530 RepID=UPI001EFCBD01|nr:hypothetical protein [Shewanella sp. Isolate11]MCG9696634.1 hypothetical protein [Shewanella sp. Isolate11]
MLNLVLLAVTISLPTEIDSGTQVEHLQRLLNQQEVNTTLLISKQDLETEIAQELNLNLQALSEHLENETTERDMWAKQ